MHIGIVARLDIPKSVELVKEITKFLLNKDIKVSIDSSLIKEISEFKEMGVEIQDMQADMIIAIGGDGTILRTQNLVNGKKIPILGINLGTVGFLTEIDPENTFTALEEVLSGNYFIEERTLLRVYHGSELPSALNEVVMMTKKPAKMLHIEISVDEEVVEELRADGLIVATPSGSTAYSMSAGGPIVDPRVEAFLIVPICPFKLGARPIVVSNESEIKVKLLRKGKRAIAVIDGQFEEEFNYPEELLFKKSDTKAYFVRLNKDFYKKVREKLTEGGINS
ncbi:MAG: NAD(+) kinase [Methanobacteriaceae archaeon]|nr:NAD(+) kinase [Methanobacteriaceae archaeon]MDP2837177.1 NAD(+) kinase [Methanobacteriaceae archaeon]MDP3035948.1 NAD(+) kinase [Methanobacteriaceae archaeon]MDP3484886.1 NAD(+) kinase [Methanobacteriaceae archaeon]MDP3623932.1 NAD(+) kinase [Methanobacteriaceae archaeon]